MTDRLTIVNWAPNDVCDPCHCHWFVFGHPLYYLDDGTINQPKTFCGVPYWGLGMDTDSGAAPGEIVSGFIDIEMTGSWAAFTTDLFFLPTSPINGYPPALDVTYLGSSVLTINPAGGELLDFTASLTGGGNDASGIQYAYGAWAGVSRVSFSTCVKLDPSLDDYFSGRHAVLPYTGPIPADARTLIVTIPNTASTPIFFATPNGNIALPGDPPDWAPTGGPSIFTSQSASVTPHPYVYAHGAKGGL
jgi:hypothetical protein